MLHKFLKSFVSIAIVFGSTLLYTSAVAEPGSYAYWNFNQADIHTLIQQVSKETGKNFIVDPRVQGKVTVISQQPLNKAEAYQVFLSILQVHGYAAIKSGKVIKIIPLDKAKTKATPPYRFAKYPDQLVVKVIPLKNATASEVLRSLKPLVDKSSHIAAYNNNLIIADTMGNIRKLEGIINQLDSTMNDYAEIIPVYHASALDLLNTLKEFTKDRFKVKNPLKLGADERTNSLLISGGTTGKRQYIKGLIIQLDAKTDNSYNSEVIYLNYTESRNIAPIVGTFLEDAMKSSQDQKLRKQIESTHTNLSQPRRSSDTSTFSNPRHLSALKSSAETGGTQGSLFNDNESRPQSGVVNRFVQWEESTNALIIKAPPTLMRAVKSIISKLDIRRPQVLIEVIIAEIAINRGKEFGVEWNPSSNASVKFGTRFPTRPNQDTNNILGGFFGGVVEQLGSGLTVGIFRHGSLRAIVRALAADRAANILSTPKLVTLDNQTALIKVGEKVPFAVGQTNNDDIGGNPFTSFDREEVGLSLTIRPQITHSGAVKLEIESILSNVIENSATDATGGNPTTSERTIVTNVMVDDGKILVLGGLIQESWQEVQSRIPIVGRLPYVGALFGSKRKELVKKNLMIFIRPVIMRDELKNIAVSNKRYDRVRDAQRRSYHTLERPFVDEPISAAPLAKEDYYPSSMTQSDVYAKQGSQIVLPLPYDPIVDSAFKR